VFSTEMTIISNRFVTSYSFREVLASILMVRSFSGRFRRLRPKPIIDGW
jgi:hypothetical protein